MPVKGTEPKIEVKTEERESFGRKHLVFIAECEGVLFEFDPLQRALKDCGLGELTGENRRDIAKKHLEYQKTGITRAMAGARLRWFLQEADGLTPDEVTSLWASAWRCHQ